MEASIKDRLFRKYFTAKYIVEKGINRYEMFCQSAQLAVEQIQEIEISFLKKKPEAKVGAILMDIFILYFLEAKVLGIAVQRASQKYVDSFGRINFLAAQYPTISRKILKGMDTTSQNFLLKNREKEMQLMDATISATEKIVTDLLQASAKVGERKLFKPDSLENPSKVFEKGNGSWANALDEIRPSIPEWSTNPDYKPNIAKGFPITSGGDALSVGVLRSVFAQYTEYKISTNSLLALLHEEITLMSFSDDDSLNKDIEDALDSIISEDQQEQTIEMDYNRIRDYHSLEIEKIIWMALYGPKMEMEMGRINDINQIADAGYIKGFEGDDSSLQNYWWARFPDPSTGLPFPNKYKLFIHLKEIYNYLLTHGIDKAVVM